MARMLVILLLLGGTRAPRLEGQRRCLADSAGAHLALQSVKADFKAAREALGPGPGVVSRDSASLVALVTDGPACDAVLAAVPQSEWELPNGVTLEHRAYVFRVRGSGYLVNPAGNINLAFILDDALRYRYTSAGI